MTFCTEYFDAKKQIPSQLNFTLSDNDENRNIERTIMRCEMCSTCTYPKSSIRPSVLLYIRSNQFVSVVFSLLLIVANSLFPSYLYAGNTITVYVVLYQRNIIMRPPHIKTSHRFRQKYVSVPIRLHNEFPVSMRKNRIQEI